MSEAIRKIWDAIKYGPEETLITYESPDKGKTVFQCTSKTNKRTSNLITFWQLIWQLFDY